MSEIMLVPLPRAASRFLMSFLTLKISICWSSSSLMTLCDGLYEVEKVRLEYE